MLDSVRLDQTVLVKHDGQVFVWREEELYQPFGSLTRFFQAKAEIGLRISLSREQRHMVLELTQIFDYAPSPAEYCPRSPRGKKACLPSRDKDVEFLSMMK